MHKNKLILLVLLLSLYGCAKKKNSYDFKNKKYEPCLLALDFKWKNDVQEKNTEKVMEIFKKSYNSYRENMDDYCFDSLVVYKGDFIFHFSNRCSEKNKILQKYVQKYLKKIDHFPEYEIKPVLKDTVEKANFLVPNFKFKVYH